LLDESLAPKAGNLTRFSYAAVVALALTIVPSGTTMAEKKKEPAGPVEQTKSNTAAAPQLMVPDSQGLAVLIHNSLIALNHANLTGNYSVLRDLAAPGFQKLNSPKQLAATFADMRARNVNLSPIVLYQPKLVRDPAIDNKGFLRMTGFYETRPLQVHFDLVFQPVAAVWRLFEISVWTAVIP
jgi:hypothetical protein